MNQERGAEQNHMADPWSSGDYSGRSSHEGSELLEQDMRMSSEEARFDENSLEQNGDETSSADGEGEEMMDDRMSSSPSIDDNGMLTVPTMPRASTRMQDGITEELSADVLSGDQFQPASVSVPSDEPEKSSADLTGEGMALRMLRHSLRDVSSLLGLIRACRNLPVTVTREVGWQGLHGLPIGQPRPGVAGLGNTEDDGSPDNDHGDDRSPRSLTIASLSCFPQPHGNTIVKHDV